MLVFGPVLLAGVVLAAVAVRERDRESAFAFEQSRLARLDRPTVERAVGSAPEPTADGTGRPARATRCRPGSSGAELRNPWRCVARYPSGETIRYTVTIEADGRFRGESPDGVRRVVGRIGLLSGG